jgi:hypothetical protein
VNTTVGLMYNPTAMMETSLLVWHRWFSGVEIVEGLLVILVASD